MSDTSNQITSFAVENFKRFESFEMTDLGQFNLLVGDNNVGKTSVLEALLVDENSKIWMSNVANALSLKKLKTSVTVKDLEYYCNQETYSQDVEGVVEFRLGRHHKLDKYFLKFEKHLQRLMFSTPGEAKPTTYDFGTVLATTNHELSSPLITLQSGHDRSLTNFYSSTIQKNRRIRGRLIESMRKFIPTFDGIELSAPFPNEEPHLIITQSDKNTTLPLALFGDGSIKFLRIVMEIIAKNGKRLMIDEIDTGIHFSRMKEFWNVILHTAHENNVQLFMTTHSEECLRFFKEALADDLSTMKDLARVVSMVENATTKQVSSVTFPFSQFEFAINAGNEVRL